MQDQPSAIFPERKEATFLTFLLGIPKVGCWIIAGLSVAVLVGWGINSQILKSVLPGFLAMSPLEALCFILASCALYIRLQQKEIYAMKFWIINFLSWSIFIIGILTFSSNSFHIKALSLFGENSMGITSSLNFMLIGIALTVFGKNQVSYFKITQFFTLIAGLITMFAGVGYLYHVVWSYQIYVFSPMQLNTISAFTLLCFSIFLSTHHYGMMRILTEDLDVSRLARRLIIAAIIIPIVLGGISIFGQKFFDPQTMTASMAVLQVVSFTVIIWIVTRIIYNDAQMRITLTNTLQQKNGELAEYGKELSQKVEELGKANQKIQSLLEHQHKLQDIASQS